MNGRFVFRTLKINVTVLVLHKQLFLPWNSRIMPYLCFNCRCDFWQGEAYVSTLHNATFGTFICYNCIPSLFGDILNERETIQNCISAMILVRLAVKNGHDMPNSISFCIGEKWKSTPNKEKIENCEFDWHSYSFYIHIERKAKKSLKTFCLCLLRLGLYKDLRQYVVKMIWPNEIISWLEE